MKVNIWRRKMVVSGKADTKFCKVVKRYRESFSNLSKFENVKPIRRNVSKSLISTLMIFKKNAKKNKPILCESSMETITSNEDLSTYEDMTLITMGMRWIPWSRKLCRLVPSLWSLGSANPPTPRLCLTWWRESITRNFFPAGSRAML